tara:strand:- start:755 stop:1246 length:492 start_codon:yes stop_codon:yes gene_type:complete
MKLNIFNPKFCLANHLKNSWCEGVAGSFNEKLPLEVANGVPRLKFTQDPASREDWFCGVLPFNSAWEVLSLDDYLFLNFNFYSEDHLCCRIGFKDEDENDSAEVEVFKIPGSTEGEECALSIPLHKFQQEGFTEDKARLLKIVGYNEASFYISEVMLSDESNL